MPKILAIALLSATIATPAFAHGLDRDTPVGSGEEPAQQAEEAFAKQDYAEALRWWKVASQQGDAEAQTKIGLLYERGLGVAQDYGEAMRWFRKAAGEGDATAQYNIGLFYKHGWGVAQDAAQAMKWYQQAAAQGSAAAEEEIGSLYFRGDGVSQDYHQAMVYLHNAAAQGDAAAENDMGILYLQGAGVLQDFAQAYTWFEKAAASGNVPAEENLARMTELGSGVRQDPARARALYEKAAGDGDATARRWLAEHPLAPVAQPAKPTVAVSAPPPQTAAPPTAAVNTPPPQTPAAPTVAAVTATVNENAENQPIALAITGTAVGVRLIGQPTHGTATVKGTQLTYTPEHGYSGSDSFAYEATNSAGASAPAAVSITVNPAAPTVAAVAATVNQNATNQPIALVITGDAASVAVTRPPGHGVAAVKGTTINYTPETGYSGPDSFIYTATNPGGTSPPATVSIMVSLLPPKAAPVAVTLNENAGSQPVALKISGQATSVAVTTPPAHGTTGVNHAEITYTPEAGYSGPDAFAYTATNASGTSDPAKVSITVSSAVPTASAVTAAVSENAASQPIALKISGQATSVAVTTPPAHGTTGVNHAEITYTPEAGYSGPDTFAYTATNASGTSDPAKVSITVSSAVPTASAVTAAVSENAASQPIALKITGQATSVAVTSAPAHGTTNVSQAEITYTPQPGYSGPDTFAYTAANASGTSDAAAVSITVKRVAPTAGAVTAVVDQNAASQPITLNITGEATAIWVMGQPTHGTATVKGTQLTYTPARDYSGPDSFSYAATSPLGTSAPAPVSITVNSATPPAAAPTAGAVTATVNQNAASQPIVLAITGDATGVAVIRPPMHGTITVNGTSIGYAPETGYSGPDSIAYTATNATGTSPPAEVSITVTAPAAAPMSGIVATQPTALKPEVPTHAPASAGAEPTLDDIIPGAEAAPKDAPVKTQPATTAPASAGPGPGAQE